MQQVVGDRVKLCSKWLLWGFVAPVFLLSPITAQEFTAQEWSNTSTYRVSLENPLGVFPVELEEAIARLANPEIVVIEAGTTLLEARKISCPGASQNYFDALGQNVNDLNIRLLGTEFDINNLVSHSTFALVPACVGSQFNYLNVEKGMLIESFFRESQTESIPLSNLNLREFLQAVEAVNDIDGFTNIPAGSVLYIPPSTVEFQATGSNAYLLKEAIELVYDPNSINVETFPDQAVQANGSDSIDDNCSPGDMASVFDSTLDSYGSIYESIMISSMFTTDRETVSIAIFDAGLRRIRHPLNAAFAQLVTDNTAGGSRIPPYQNPIGNNFCRVSNDSTHSEVVTGVATGGYFSTLHNAFANVIDVYTHNIHNDDPLVDGTNYCISRNPKVRMLADAIREMSKRPRVDVVNLSQSWSLAGISKYEIDQLRSVVEEFSGDSAPFLLVVSAGNNAQSIEEEGTARLPAQFGGTNNTAMIVVAATQGDGELHPSSSFGNETVDIGALGCNVPTLLFDQFGEPDTDTFFRARLQHSFESGTSLAAPQVTYTAAMIQYLSGRKNRPTPIQIKRRILVTADINGFLAGQIIDGRMLNISNALNIFTDLIKLDNGTIYRGKAYVGDPNSQRVHVCSGLTLDDPTDLLRIAKISEGENGGQYLIYYLTGTELETEICSELSRDISINFLELDGSYSDKTEVILRTDIVDVIFSMDL